MTRILIIDPVEGRANRQMRVLRSAGYRITTKHPAQPYQAAIRIEQPAIIVIGSAVGFPTISDLILSVRSIPAGMNAAILALQQSENAPANASLLRLGADKVLGPQTTDGAIISAAHALLQRKSMLLNDNAELPWALAEDNAPFVPKP